VPVLRAWLEHLAVTDDEAGLLHIAAKPEEAIELLRQQLAIRNS
jgi:hypothetical protein